MKFQLIVITPPETLVKETTSIVALFKNGLKLIHVRKPNFSYSELKNYLELIPIKYYSRIVIHSHYRLHKEFGLRGIHLTEATRKRSSVQKYIREAKPKHISTSFHSINEIKKTRRKYDYVFLSPVFDSISKTGYSAAFDLEELKKELPLLNKKQNVIALGGIDNKTIQQSKQLGFMGAAALGYVWESKISAKHYEALASKIK